MPKDPERNGKQSQKEKYMNLFRFQKVIIYIDVNLDFLKIFINIRINKLNELTLNMKSVCLDLIEAKMYALNEMPWRIVLFFPKFIK